MVVLTAVLAIGGLTFLLASLLLLKRHWNWTLRFRVAQRSTPTPNPKPP